MTCFKGRLQNKGFQDEGPVNSKNLTGILDVHIYLSINSRNITLKKKKKTVQVLGSFL